MVTVRIPSGGVPPDIPVSEHTRIKYFSLARYPSDFPGRKEPLELMAIFESNHYAKKRDVFSVILLPKQLAPSEICAIARRLEHFAAMYNCPGPKFTVTHGELQFFIAAIFYQWKSDQAPGPKPVMLAPTFQDRAIHVGTLQHDLEPLPGLWERGLHCRKEGDKAYLHVSFDLITEAINVTWKEGNGLTIEREDVCLEPACQTQTQRLNYLFENYNFCEQQRVMEYNWKVS